MNLESSRDQEKNATEKSKMADPGAQGLKPKGKIISIDNTGVQFSIDNTGVQFTQLGTKTKTGNQIRH